MAATSINAVTDNNSTPDEEWTTVLRRRGKKGRKLFRSKTHEQQPSVTLEPQPWVPTDLETDDDSQLRLRRKIEISMKNIESSQFYKDFLDQVQSPETLDRFYSVLGSETGMQMVIYGIGSLESYENPRFQLSLALLMKRKFSWIAGIEVFDPVLTETECRVLLALGCSPLLVNENGRRQAHKPTLFFMPHCEAELYNHLLQANWKTELLNRVVLFGNSFETYEKHVLEYKRSSIVYSCANIVAARRFTNEFAVKTTVSDDYFAAFHDSSWHFFSPGHESELQLIDT